MRFWEPSGIHRRSTQERAASDAAHRRDDHGSSFPAFSWHSTREPQARERACMVTSSISTRIPRHIDRLWRTGGGRHGDRVPRPRGPQRRSSNRGRGCVLARSACMDGVGVAITREELSNSCRVGAAEEATHGGQGFAAYSNRVASTAETNDQKVRPGPFVSC